MEVVVWDILCFHKEVPVAKTAVQKKKKKNLC